MVLIGFWLNHMLILEIILEACWPEPRVESTAYEINVLKVREGGFPRGILGCYKYRRRGNSCQAAKATKFLHTSLSKLNEGHPGKRPGLASQISHGFSPHMDKLIWAIRLCFNNITVEIQI